MVDESDCKLSKKCPFSNIITIVFENIQKIKQKKIKNEDKDITNRCIDLNDTIIKKN